MAIESLLWPPPVTTIRGHSQRTCATTARVAAGEATSQRPSAAAPVRNTCPPIQVLCLWHVSVIAVARLCVDGARKGDRMQVRPHQHREARLGTFLFYLTSARGHTCMSAGMHTSCMHACMYMRACACAWRWLRSEDGGGKLECGLDVIDDAVACRYLFARCCVRWPRLLGLAEQGG